MDHAVDLPVVEPMLATPSTTLPPDRGFAAEAKWDGIRCIARISRAGVRLSGRHGGDLTGRYPEIAAALAELPLDRTTLDGELVQLDEQGRPSFSLLQQRIHLTRPEAVQRLARARPVTFVVFDVLHLEEPTLQLPYVRRRELLAGLELGGARIKAPPHWTQDGAAAFAWTAEHGLEGVVAKRLQSRYTPGTRTADWIKVKHVRTVDIVIGGWIPGGPDGALVKSLLCGVPERGGLRYVGNVGTGFAQAERRALAAVLRRLESARMPFIGTLPPPRRGDVVHWVRPVLGAEVQYQEWTRPERRLRHPVWRGLREPGP
ncbi:bifunctional non-homologous end joining protein LigD [Kitasatospora sp. MAP12-15]|uniref:non-homologous end-joining DNA ligase n=1 Tax=unclassified Kitasatospora TaxID=2633591 RepID=UPI0024764CA2|nr:non-homologous end-joining DNA ligase [Kitasatospora sp. MAP12-44]MDH6108700.1 bifunctional non-homologous end joining protein LigD [Kitasatospora sp. MAP12-44]